MRVYVRFIAVGISFAVAACAFPIGERGPDDTPTKSNSSAQVNTPSVAITQLPAIGRRIAFVAEDGTPLLGEFFPARNKSAPTVVLMHQLGANRRYWVNIGIVDWLVNPLSAEERISPRRLNWPALPEDLSFSVFIFDFRGHGESRGEATDHADYIMDAQAAQAVVRTFPEVDPTNIALIGTSIGADASVDVCDGCAGALAISPGSYLGVDFAERVSALGQVNVPTWCLAGSEDTRSMDACLSSSGPSYKSLIYPNQAAHGFDLFMDGLEPEITMVVRDFLKETFGL